MLSTKVVVFVKSGRIRAKVVIFWQGSCIQESWLHSGKVVVFGQSGCIRAKEVVLGQKWLYSY